MKKFIFIILAFVFWTLCSVLVGYKLKNAEPIIIQGETIWKDKIVYKNIYKMSEDEKNNELKHYYNDEFKLTFRPLSDINMYRIEGKLYEREAYKDIEISCGESGNWKLYAGFGLAAVVGTAVYIKVR